MVDNATTVCLEIFLTFLSRCNDWHDWFKISFVRNIYALTLHLHSHSSKMRRLRGHCRRVKTWKNATTAEILGRKVNACLRELCRTEGHLPVSFRPFPPAPFLGTLSKGAGLWFALCKTEERLPFLAAPRNPRKGERCRPPDRWTVKPSIASLREPTVVGTTAGIGPDRDSIRLSRDGTLFGSRSRPKHNQIWCRAVSLNGEGTFYCRRAFEAKHDTAFFFRSK